MAKILIQMDSIQKVFYSDDVETHALSNINLGVNEGEYVSITGPSGCGKSTLLSIIGLLDSATSGDYELASNRVTGLSTRQMAEIRNREIGFIFQSFNLISDMTVEENIELPLRYRDNLASTARETMVSEALEKVAMSHRKSHYPSQLSGGQQQRVAIARAIAGNPSLILADEPTGNLDSKNAEAVLNILDALHREGATICMVTHNPESALRAERSIQMLDGQIVADNRNVALQSKAGTANTTIEKEVSLAEGVVS